MPQVEYPFEMTDVLKATMNVVAEKVRELGDDAIHGKRYKVKEAAREVIRGHVGDFDDQQKLYNQFCTSYDNACDAIRDGSFTLSVADDEAIYTDHDGAMEAGKHFNGHVVKEVESPKTNRWGKVTDTNLYLIFRHAETRHEICNCPSQRYHLWCKHSIANQIDRNLPEPTDLYDD